MARGPEPKPLRMSRRVYRELKKLVRRHRAPAAVVQRARALLLARSGQGTEEIAQRLGCSSRNVRKWKARFRANPTLAALEDAPRCGRPASVPRWVRCTLVQLACDRPEGIFTPFREVWTRQTLADELARRAVAAQRPIPDRAEVVRALGGLIVEGRVDERAGRFVLRTVSDGWGRAAA